MKSYILYSLITLSFFLVSCSKDNITDYKSAETQKGSIFLQLDKENAPSNVVKVISYLSRENYDTLTANLNLISESSADIMFEDIAVGEWHLTVEALNEDAVVVYRGETDVEILEGITIQVSLVLNPTGQGTGDLYINVTWGTNESWIDFPGNPVFKKEDSPVNPLMVTQGKVLFEDGIYKMWFTNLFNSAHANVGYAESTNGLVWKIANPSPVLLPGESGSWDDYTVTVGPVIKDGSGYKMFYNGWRDQYNMWHIGLASSPDGINWTKNSEPVLYATENEHQIGASDIIKVNNVYYMYFIERHYPYYTINLAVSENGINWERYGNNPILEADQSWEGTGIYYPSVIVENGQFAMVYMNAAASGFGMAVSEDGKVWRKKNNNPFFVSENSFNKWAKRIAYPFFRKFGNEYRIYYTGYDFNNEGMIGVLRKF
ncbi:MAG: hypothetical protein ACM339_03340 [Ignavibacteria bacterium]